MVSYICTLCDYKSTKKTDYSKHCLTKKHLEKATHDIKNNKNSKDSIPKAPQSAPKTVENRYKCLACGHTFGRLCNLSRHKKICTEHNSILNKYEEVKEQKEYYKKLFEEAGGLVKKSVIAMSYSINNYPDAPILKAIEISDISEFSGDNNKKITEDVKEN